MEEKITFNELLLFAFNETELSDTVAVTRAIETDEEIRESYEDLVSTIHGVHSVSVLPSERVMESILRYAR